MSPTQRKALEALDAGARIVLVLHSGHDLSNSAAMFPKNGGMVRISTATLEALRVQGWLTSVGDPEYDWRGSTYVISAKGREQLAKECREDEFKTGAKRLRSMRRRGIKW